MNSPKGIQLKSRLPPPLPQPPTREHGLLILEYLDSNLCSIAHFLGVCFLTCKMDIIIVGDLWGCHVKWDNMCKMHSIPLVPGTWYSSPVHIKYFLRPSVQFNRSVVSDCLQPHELQHARLSCPSPTPRACSNSCPLSRWCHPTISSCHHLLLPPSIFPSIRSFPRNQFFPSSGQSIGASVSALPMNI